MGKKFYQHPAYNRVYGDKVVTPRAPAAWPSLVTAREAPEPQPGQKKGEPRFEVTLVLAKDAESTKGFEAQIGDMVQQMVDQYNVTMKKLGQARIAIDDVFIDGDGGKFDLEKYPYYANSWLLMARNVKRPVFKNYKGEKFADATVFQGGDIVRCEITPHLGATGISYKLEAVQLIKRGEVSMGGGVLDHGKLLDAEEDGEDLVQAGAPMPADAVKDVDPEEETSEDTAAEAPVESLEDAANEVLGQPEMEPEPEPAPAPTPTKPAKAVTVQLTGKALAEDLKAKAVAAAKAKATPATQPAKAAKGVEPVATKAVAASKSGKAAAVDML